MLLFLLAAAHFAGTTLASCECGYRTNTGQIWQFRIATNFSISSNITTSFAQDWQVVDKLQGDVTSSTPYQINYTSANVIFPANSSRDASSLTLITSAYTGAAGGAVASGEISTIRNDILFGSFRASYAVTGGSGACAGFFSYADDTNENDVEILTKDGNDQVQFTNQAVDTSNSTFAATLPNNALTTETQDYRFDWTIDAVKYYVNDYFLANITNNPSQEASQIFLNAWSNGDNFTGGPPVEDMQMAIRSMTLYFNSSNADTVAQYTSACSAAGSASVCSADSSNIIYSSTTASSSAVPQFSAQASAARSVVSSSAMLNLTYYSLFVVCALCMLTNLLW